MKNTINKLIALLLIMTLSIVSNAAFGFSTTAQAAEHTASPEILIQMQDSYGDGWGGSGIQVYEGSTLLTTATISAGASAQVRIPYTPGLSYTFRWVRAAYAAECSFEISLRGECKASGTGDQYPNGETILVLEEACVHEYQEVVTPPGCTEQGFTTHLCTLCGYYYNASYTSALGHRYADSLCIGCGQSISREFCYEILWDGTCSITDYTGSASHLIIPSEIDGYPVSSIGNYSSPIGIVGAFEGNKNLISVTVPEGVTYVAYRAFYGCKNLTTISFPDTLTGIGSDSFMSCTNLTNIHLPESVTEIGANAFTDCPDRAFATYNNAKYLGTKANPYIHLMDAENVKKVVIHPQTKHISDYAFSGCKNLAIMDIPSGVTTIGACAFQSCSSLTSITIPESVTGIAYSAFSGCSKLSYHTYDGASYLGDGTNFYLHLIDAPNVNRITLHPNTKHIAQRAFASCTNLTEITFPQGIAHIEGEVFSNCSALTSVTIPDSTVRIDSTAFSTCSSLTDINIHPNNPAYYSDGKVIFSKDQSILILGPAVSGAYTVPEGVQIIGSSAFSGCSNLVEVTLPESVTLIGNSAFYKCQKLTQINIPDSVTQIGQNAFYECYALSEIHLPNRIRNIARSAFAYCQKLTQVTIPSQVVRIEDSAFSGCIGLTEITIPEKVTRIGSSAFNYCRNLTVIRFLGSAPTFCENTLSGGYTCFSNVTATAYYPAEDPTWETVILDGYGGKLTWVAQDAAHGVTLAGKVSSFGNNTESLAVALWTEGGEAPAYTAVITHGSYRFENIPQGSYLLKISMDGGVTRTYPVELGSETSAPDVKICPLGDMDGNGKVNIGDVARAYAHSRKTGEILDPYALSCGDLNGDGKINIGDVAKLYGHTKGSTTIAS